MGMAETRSKTGLRPQPTDEKDSSGTLRPPSAHEEVGLASRWGLRGKKGQSLQDNPLLSAFARLRSDLKICKGIVESFQDNATDQL